MTFLFYSALVLFFSAIAGTIFALLSAPRGYEDDTGFHAVRQAHRSGRLRSTITSNQTVSLLDSDADDDTSVLPAG
jgi:hypothetical protein